MPPLFSFKSTNIKVYQKGGIGMSKMIKKFAAILVLSVAMFTTFSIGSVDAASWNIKGTPAGCSSGCGYVISNGTVTNSPISGTKYNGYASTVWPGGYGDPVTLKVYATATTAYANGGTAVWSDSETRTVNGLRQVLVSVPVVATHSAFYAFNATVTARGTISSDWFYYSMSATGKYGV